MLGHFQSQWWQVKNLTANRRLSAADLPECGTTANASSRRVVHDTVRRHHLFERRARMTGLCARLFSTACAQGRRALTWAITGRRLAAVVTIGGELLFRLRDT